MSREFGISMSRSFHSPRININRNGNAAKPLQGQVTCCRCSTWDVTVIVLVTGCVIKVSEVTTFDQLKTQ